MEFDTRLPSNGLAVFVGASGVGKTTAVLDLIAGRTNTFQKPISRILILAAHAEQPAYSQLTRYIPSVGFYQIDRRRGISQADLKREFNLDNDRNPSTTTRLLIIDDVPNPHLIT